MAGEAREHQVYLNGEILPQSKAGLPLLSFGLQEGFGVFEMTRTFAGRPFKLPEHIHRLLRSLRYVRIDLGLSPEEVERITLQVLGLNESLRGENGDFWIGHTVFHGGTWPVSSETPTVAVYCVPLPFARWARCYREGVSAVITSIRRTPPECVDPKVKVLSRINLQLAQLEAARLEPGALPILLDLQGNVSEGCGMNVMMVRDGAVVTPTDRSILRGISRQTVLELAAELGMGNQERDFQPYDLYNAEEAFFTTTSRCIIPITRVDGLPLSGGAPGPVTMRLLRRWGERVGVDIAAQALSHLENRSA